MAVYGFLNEGLIKNIKDSRAAAAQRKEDKAKMKEEEAEYKKLIPKVQAADKKVRDKYTKDPTIRKKMASSIKSYLKKMEDDPNHELDDWEVEDCKYYIEHPEEIDIKYYPKEVQYDYANGGCISINITDANAAVATAINSVVCAIGKDIAKELGDIGTPYTITGPNLDEDDFGTCYFKFKGSNNESAINEGLHLFNKNKKDAKQIQQKSSPLNSEQKADAKKIIAEIKKIAPSVISDMNKNKDYMNALNAAVDEVDWDPDDDIEDDVRKKLKPVSRKWVCSEFKPFDNKENQLVVCCMDKSIMDAYYLMSDAGYVDHHFNKYSRTPIYNAGKEIVSKLTDTYGLKVNVDADSIDGCILFIIHSSK